MSYSKGRQEDATQILVHYFRLAGVEVGAGAAYEISEAVEAIVDAAVDEAKRQIEAEAAKR